MDSVHLWAEELCMFWPIFKEKMPKLRSSPSFSRLRTVILEMEGDPPLPTHPRAVVPPLRWDPGVIAPWR